MAWPIPQTPSFLSTACAKGAHDGIRQMKHSDAAILALVQMGRRFISSWDPGMSNQQKQRTRGSAMCRPICRFGLVTTGGSRCTRSFKRVCPTVSICVCSSPLFFHPWNRRLLMWRLPCQTAPKSLSDLGLLMLLCHIKRFWTAWAGHCNLWPPRGGRRPPHTPAIKLKLRSHFPLWCVQSLADWPLKSLLRNTCLRHIEADALDERWGIVYFHMSSERAADATVRPLVVTRSSGGRGHGVQGVTDRLCGPDWP